MSANLDHLPCVDGPFIRGGAVAARTKRTNQPWFNGAATKLWLYANFHGSKLKIFVPLWLGWLRRVRARTHKTINFQWLWSSLCFNHFELQKVHAKFRIVGLVRSNDFETFTACNCARESHIKLTHTTTAATHTHSLLICDDIFGVHLSEKQLRSYATILQ